MALTTRANVLQMLGLSDDATNTAAFVAWPTDGGTGTITIPSPNQVASAGSSVRLENTMGGDVTHDFADSDNDTITEIVAAINGESDWAAEIVTGVDGTLPTSLVTDATYSSVTIGDPAQVLYTNPGSGTTAAFIDGLINVATDAAARFCNRMVTTSGVDSPGWESSTYVEVFDGTHAPTLLLSAAPVTSITSIVETDDDGDTSTLSADSYRLDGPAGIIHRLSSSWGYTSEFGWGDGPAIRRHPFPRFNAGPQKYTVTYVGGYATVPDDLEWAIRRMVADLFMDAERDRNLQTHTAGAVSSTRVSVDEVVRRYEMDLGPFKRPGRH